jgi:hypothetical protein
VCCHSDGISKTAREESEKKKVRKRKRKRERFRMAFCYILSLGSEEGAFLRRSRR